MLAHSKTETNPLRRNTSADKEINELDSLRTEYLRQRQEKQIELDVINSNISSIEAQIANIIMNKPKPKKGRSKCRK